MLNSCRVTNPVIHSCVDMYTIISDHELSEIEAIYACMRAYDELLTPYHDFSIIIIFIS